MRSGEVVVTWAGEKTNHLKIMLVSLLTASVMSLAACPQLSSDAANANGLVSRQQEGINSEGADNMGSLSLSSECNYTCDRLMFPIQ